jgi:hypothetical protein
MNDPKVYDLHTNTWYPEHFAEHPVQPARFVGFNQECGPACPDLVLTNPNLFTIQAIQNHKPRRSVGAWLSKLFQPVVTKYFFAGGGEDLIPPMPLALIQKIESYLQPGDIILQGNDVAKDGKNRKDLMHGLIYLGKTSEGKGLAAHAIGVPRNCEEGILKPAVCICFWEDAIQRDVNGADRLQVLRIPHMTQQDFNNVAHFVISETGKPYDFVFNTRNAERYYCTEFVFRAYKQMSNPFDIRFDKKTHRLAVTGRSFQEAADAGIIESILLLNPSETSSPLR